jgi:hypothetical protein
VAGPALCAILPECPIRLLPSRTNCDDRKSPCFDFALRDAKLYEIGARMSEMRRLPIGRELYAKTAE